MVNRVRTDSAVDWAVTADAVVDGRRVVDRDVRDAAVLAVVLARWNVACVEDRVVGAPVGTPFLLAFLAEEAVDIDVSDGGASRGAKAPEHLSAGGAFGGPGMWSWATMPLCWRLPCGGQDTNASSPVGGVAGICVCFMFGGEPGGRWRERLAVGDARSGAVRGAASVSSSRKCSRWVATREGRWGKGRW